ncbi:MAG: sulfotransferase domain-containing protein [Gammaproteobacteria bacterium]
MTLPNFIIIGAYKSGTTSLYHYLRQHPDVFMPVLKEPNFFAHERKKELLKSEDRNEIVIDKLDDYRRLFDDVSTEKAIGEASPLYLGTELAAQRIWESIPTVKLIAILREHSDAFYSDHKMRIRDKRKLEGDLWKRFEQMKRRIESGENAGPLYGQHLKRYYERFDPSQIRVFLYEDLINDGPEVLRQIFAFLGVDESFTLDTSKRHNPGGIPKNDRFDRLLKRLIKSRKMVRIPLMKNLLQRIQHQNLEPVPPFPAELRNAFVKLFYDDTKQLESLINRDLSAWLK